MLHSPASARARLQAPLGTGASWGRRAAAPAGPAELTLTAVAAPLPFSEALARTEARAGRTTRGARSVRAACMPAVLQINWTVSANVPVTEEGGKAPNTDGWGRANPSAARQHAKGAGGGPQLTAGPLQESLQSIGGVSQQRSSAKMQALSSKSCGLAPAGARQARVRRDDIQRWRVGCGARGAA